MIKEIIMLPQKVLVWLQIHCPVSKYIYIFFPATVVRDSMQAHMKRAALCPKENRQGAKKAVLPLFLQIGT